MTAERRRGFTLAELMVTIAILGIVFSLAPKVMIDTYKFFRLSMARSEIQRDARAALDLMNRKLRQAEASSIVVSRHDSSQPPYSKVFFNTVDTSSITFYQAGRQIYMQEGAENPRKIADNLRYMAFTYAETDKDTIMSVSVTFEKDVYQGKAKALQMAVEKVRVMND